MTQKGFTDEMKLAAALAKTGAPAGEALPDTHNRWDKFFDAPLRVFASSPADTLINIASNKVQLGDGAGLAKAASDSTLPDFVDTTIDVQTGAVTGGTVKSLGAAFAWPAGTVGQVRRMVLVYRSGENVVDTAFSAEAASVAALDDPGVVFGLVAGDQVAFVDLECTDALGKYKTAGSATAIVENSVGGESRIVRIAASGGGGGAGGSSVNWLELPGLAPISTIENSVVPVFLFPQGGSQKLVAFWKIPKGHSSGKQIVLPVVVYSPATSGTIFIKATAYLVRDGQDTPYSTTLSHASSNAAIANAGSAGVARMVDLDLTDAIGKVAGEAAAAGNMLRIELERGTDTDTEDLRFVPWPTEVQA